MSLDVKITIPLDTATPALRLLVANMAPHRLATLMSPALTRHWRDHLAALPRNKKGYPSTGFWEEAARQVTAVATDAGCLLSCAKLGVRQRFHGGAIHAESGKYLTIPIAPESYGVSATEWGDTLTLVILADGRKFLALWTGDAETAGDYKAARLGRTSKRVNSRKVHQFREAAAGRERPKVIIFKGSGSAGVGRAEKHMDLKFLYVLVTETAPQEGNPDVVPSDLGAVALDAVRKGLKL